MATIKQFRKRVNQINLLEISHQALAATYLELLEYNSMQMLEGKRRDGKDISPSYLEDPYFKTVDEAIGYSEWKDRITPNPKRKRGVPNLYIDGTFHNSISATVSGNIIRFNSTFEAANDIVRKFSDKIFGLNSEKRAEYIPAYLRPEFMQYIKKVLHL